MKQSSCTGYLTKEKHDMTIDQTLERGIALAKTPEQRRKVEFYITEIAATVNDLTKTPILTDAAAGDYYIQIESAADFADYTLMLDVA